MSKKYYYPTRNSENHSRVSLVEVSEEFYRAVQPEIDRVRKRNQRNGSCVCPKKMLWACDLDCLICEYHASGKMSSLDEPLGSDDENLTLGGTLESDEASLEDLAVDRDLLKALYEALEELDPEGRRMCELMKNCSEREAATLMGMPRSTFKRHWEKVREKLAEKLTPYKN